MTYPISIQDLDAHPNPPHDSWKMQETPKRKLYDPAMAGYDPEGYEPVSIHDSSDGESMLFSSTEWIMTKREPPEDMNTFSTNHIDLIVAVDPKQQLELADQLAQESMGIEVLEDDDQHNQTTETTSTAKQSKGQERTRTALNFQQRPQQEQS